MSKRHPPAAAITIQDVVGALPWAPLCSTRDRDWAGVTMDVYGSLPGYSLRMPAYDHHLICYCPGGGARLIQTRDGKAHAGLFSTGMSLMMPAGHDSAWEGDAAASARLRIPTALVATAAEQLGRRAAPFEIRNVFEMRDTVIGHIALTLMGELDRPPHPAQRLIADALSCALAAHLLRSHNAFDPAPAAGTASLSAVELARLTDYIEDNLDRRIGLAELADLVGVSRFHLTRLFKRATGVTVGAYVERCRIHRAQALIADGALSLAQVALVAGFADQSHFTRRFQRQVGCTPGAYARERGHLRRAR
ncbi:MAG: AraC family transcriptional regulator [Azospirillaceae bacterium]|nr:AraC family transcriptional regulator [Azospirillaceae bacterium]